MTDVYKDFIKDIERVEAYESYRLVISTVVPEFCSVVADIGSVIVSRLDDERVKIETDQDDIYEFKKDQIIALGEGEYVYKADKVEVQLEVYETQPKTI